MSGITGTWREFTGYVKIMPNVSKITFMRTEKRLGNATLYLAGATLVPDVPTQAEVDAAQTKAIDALAKGQEGLNKAIAVEAKNNTRNTENIEKFKRQQILLNDQFSEALALQQDMIEQLDICTPKQWSYVPRNFRHKLIAPNPHNPGTSCTRFETPYYYLYYENDGRFTIEARGTWLGTLRLSLNTAGGQVDDTVLNMTSPSSIRVRTVTIGSGMLAGFSHGGFYRLAVVQVFPKSLARSCKVKWNKGVTSVVEDRNNLIRARSNYNAKSQREGKPNGYIRLKNFTKCLNGEVNVRRYREDGTYILDRIKVGQRIPPTKIYFMDEADPLTSDWEWHFEEITDYAGSYNMTR